MVKKRRRHSTDYKFRFTLEALDGGKTINQLSNEHQIHPKYDEGLDKATAERRA